MKHTHVDIPMSYDERRRYQAWVSFIVALTSMVIGIAVLPVSATARMFLEVGLLLAVGAGSVLTRSRPSTMESRPTVADRSATVQMAPVTESVS